MIYHGPRHQWINLGKGTSSGLVQYEINEKMVDIEHKIDHWRRGRDTAQFIIKLSYRIGGNLDEAIREN